MKIEQPRIIAERLGAWRSKGIWRQVKSGYKGQTVIFSPMAMINGWASYNEALVVSEAVKQVKEFALPRMQMMPCTSTANSQSLWSWTPFRWMQFERGLFAGNKKRGGRRPWRKL